MDRRSTAARSSIRNDIDACQLSLHGTEHIGFRLTHRPFHVHHSDGTGQVSLALSSITCHNDFVQLVGFLLQLDVHLCCRFHLDGGVTDVRDGEKSALTGI